MRAILGAMKSTPISEMEASTSVEPRKQSKILSHSKKIKRVPDHPLLDEHQDLKQKQNITKQNTKL